MKNTHGVSIFGRDFIIDLNVRGGIRRSPGANKRARCIGREARGKSLAERKTIFAEKCKVSGS